MNVRLTLSIYVSVVGGSSRLVLHACAIIIIIIYLWLFVVFIMILKNLKNLSQGCNKGCIHKCSQNHWSNIWEITIKHMRSSTREVTTTRWLKDYCIIVFFLHLWINIPLSIPPLNTQCGTGGLHESEMEIVRYTIHSHTLMNEIYN